MYSPMFFMILAVGTLPHPSYYSTPNGNVTMAMVTPNSIIDSGNLYIYFWDNGYVHYSSAENPCYDAQAYYFSTECHS
jgi:hypothetical protein